MELYSLPEIDLVNIQALIYFLFIFEYYLLFISTLLDLSSFHFIIFDCVLISALTFWICVLLKLSLKLCFLLSPILASSYIDLVFIYFSLFGPSLIKNKITKFHIRLYISIIKQTIIFTVSLFSISILLQYSIKTFHGTPVPQNINNKINDSLTFSDRDTTQK